VVSARKLPGVGTVLVNRSGKTIYSPQQEAHGKILCTGSCLAFWFPVPAGAGAALQAPSGVTGALGTIRRPDGRTQLTGTSAIPRSQLTALRIEAPSHRLLLSIPV
jgi:predicted lipoprotein with Yx(FWY)xxD motif